MITCTLGEKKYTVDFVSGRALREMEPASKMYGRLVRLSQDATEGKDVSQEQLTEYYREAMNPTEGESDPPEDGPSVFLLDVSPAESSEYQPSYNKQYPFHFKSLDSLVDFQGIYYISIFS